MPRNNVSDLITDQEIAFARLVLSGTMTDRDAAQAVGLNPDTAAYTKSKPRVCGSTTVPPCSNNWSSRKPQDCFGETAPQTSSGPPLGNRQSSDRNS